jgi:DTW domain-containing protein YfiP
MQAETSVSLIMHRRERPKQTNTGRLLEMTLGAEVRVHGLRESNLAPPLGDGRYAVLFPGPGARPIEEARGEGLTLIVPDGTWRQCSRMLRQLPWLGALPRVTLPEHLQPLPNMRAMSRPGCMATSEAVAHALGILEGEHLRRPLLRLTRMMVERTLFCRGDLPASRVFGGVPGHARPNDPLAS